MSESGFGLAVFGASVFIAAATWAWPRVAALLPRRRRSVVHAGRGTVNLQGAGAKSAPIEAAAQVLGGRWALERVIGRGGMGRVWEGTDRRSGARVAVKTMEVADAETRKVLRQIYLAEARALSRLRHPNVVDFIEATPDGDGVALVFAFVRGKTIQQMLAEEKRLDWEAARAVFAAVARALGAVHAAGVVHRDLKPANIMVTDEGIVKVMDFGVARLVAADPHAPTEGPARREDAKPSLTARTSTLVGTPAYMPPESVSGLITTQGDLFSTGVCLYEALTGRLPFGPDGWSPSTEPMRRPVASFARLIPPPVEVLLDELFEPDPGRRLRDAATLEKRLLEI
ncbi:MAG: serine/threonine protein kinase [Elusimicrobia bacterium]|nr:serine/threonine protein kinase [Elusimicrobiota bacterium]